jgi:hypothetical protein
MQSARVHRLLCGACLRGAQHRRPNSTRSSQPTPGGGRKRAVSTDIDRSTLVPTRSRRYFVSSERVNNYSNQLITRRYRISAATTRNRCVTYTSRAEMCINIVLLRYCCTSNSRRAHTFCSRTPYAYGTRPRGTATLVVRNAVGVLFFSIHTPSSHKRH